MHFRSTPRESLQLDGKTMKDKERVSLKSFIIIINRLVTFRMFPFCPLPYSHFYISMQFQVMVLIVMQYSEGSRSYRIKWNFYPDRI